ncbi:glutathione S-transferase E14-like isoform X2 [Danaus plexippus]|uniref:glutathione S-transferase E14-like isoform X2 n=1 Tax=Danaus plexippus TaxID=13037 RepID=UPI002AB32567|nr:glutathione S-transferase E14-like isoform X2 [Danaus plexippus]
MRILRNVIKNIVCNNLLSRRYIHSSMVMNESKFILYGDEKSPPVRFVLMTASVLGVDLHFQKVDLFKNEHRSESYRKINPLQKVPAMVTESSTICDSHAISLYLCEVAGLHGLQLYPADIRTRSVINELLFFNSSTLFRLDSEIMTMFFAGNWPPTEVKMEEWNKALDYLEHRLKKTSWLAGEKMLLCDICAVTVVTSVLPLFPLTKRHFKVNKWISQFENVACYGINKRGLSDLSFNIESYKKLYGFN